MFQSNVPMHFTPFQIKTERMHTQNCILMLICSTKHSLSLDISEMLVIASVTIPLQNDIYDSKPSSKTMAVFAAWF